MLRQEARSAKSVVDGHKSRGMIERLIPLPAKTDAQRAGTEVVVAIKNDGVWCCQQDECWGSEVLNKSFTKACPFWVLESWPSDSGLWAPSRPGVGVTPLKVV